MRLPGDYRLTSSIKDRNHLTPRKRRIEKICEQESGEELEEAMCQKEPETEKKSILPPRFIGNRTSWV